MDVIKGKTSHGFKFAVPLDRLNRYSTIKLLKEVDKDNSKIVDVIPAILGEDGEAKLIEALGGDPSFQEMAAELNEIFTIMKENREAKKSSPLPN